MATERLVSELHKALTIIDGWSSKPVSSIEREIVLEKLRSVYESVIFFDGEQDQTNQEIIAPIPMDATADEESAEMLDIVTDLQEEEQIEYPIESYIKEDEDNSNSNEQADTEYLFEEDSIEEQNEDEDEDEDEENNTIVWIDEEYFEDEEEENAEEVNDVEEEDNAEEEEDLFEKEIANRNTMDHSLIESLYGETDKDIIQDNDHNTVDILDIEEATPSAYNLEEVQDDEQKIDLRSSIGMNDKFLMIRNLFGGDQDLYEQTIDTLEAMEDLDEALLYINDNFNWDPDDRSVNMLVGLLEDQLS